MNDRAARDELRRLLAGSSERPWTSRISGDAWYVNSGREPGTCSVTCGMKTRKHETIAASYLFEHGEIDAALIVAAVNALPGLLAQLDRYEEALREIARGDYGLGAHRQMARAALEAE